MSWLKRSSDSKDHELFPMCNVFQLLVLGWESRDREGSLEEANAVTSLQRRKCQSQWGLIMSKVPPQAYSYATQESHSL